MSYENNLPIKSWAEDDRPREKLLKKGKSTLSDAELDSYFNWFRKPGRIGCRTFKTNTYSSPK